MFRLTTYERIYELTYILLSFLAFQIAKYLLYINDRIVNVCMYLYIYILNLPFCTNVYSTSLLNGTKKYIEIPIPNAYQSRIQKKKDSMNQYFGLSSKEIITRFTVFFVLIVKQRRYFGKKRSLNLFVEVTLRRNSFPEVYLS